MGGCLENFEKAKAHALDILGLLAEDGFTLEQIETVPIDEFGSVLRLESAEGEDATDEVKPIAESIPETGDDQLTFRIMKDGEEHDMPLSEPVDGQTTAKFQITIGPCRGFDCWFVPSTGTAHRL